MSYVVYHVMCYRLQPLLSNFVLFLVLERYHRNVYTLYHYIYKSNVNNDTFYQKQLLYTFLHLIHTSTMHIQVL